jgi:hypothetical protein
MTMPAILICDAPGCGKQSPFSITPSGRYHHALGWWVARKHNTIVVACCAEHLAAGADVVPAEIGAPMSAGTPDAP